MRQFNINRLDQVLAPVWHIQCKNCWTAVLVDGVVIYISKFYPQTLSYLKERRHTAWLQSGQGIPTLPIVLACSFRCRARGNGEICNSFFLFLQYPL